MRVAGLLRVSKIRQKAQKNFTIHWLCIRVRLQESSMNQGGKVEMRRHQVWEGVISANVSLLSLLSYIYKQAQIDYGAKPYLANIDKVNLKRPGERN